MNKKYGALTSSVNPQELSLTVTAIVRFAFGLMVAGGIITATGANTVMEQVPALVAAGYSTVMALEALWGIARKLTVAFSKNDVEDNS